MSDITGPSHQTHCRNHGSEKRVYIGLGSNIDNPVLQLDHAIRALSLLPSSTLVSTSPYFRSTPVGPQDQPDFINAAAALNTRLSPEQLLQSLQSIEQQQGRIKKRHWGERSIDLDILLYGDQTLESEHLCIPHRELANRDFVLRPLLELNPTLSLPDGTPLTLLLKHCPNNQLQRIE